VLAGSGPPVPREGGRGAGGGRGSEPAYPEGAFATPPPRYSINGMYGTITNRFAPPYTKIYKYDLNTGTIKWAEGFGDDPALAAMGITNTGTTQMRNSILVTAGGVLLGAGRDGYVRAWDADTGKRLWQSPVGGNTTGQPAIYEVDGKTYLLVAAGPASLPGTQPAAGAAPAGGAAAQAAAGRGGAGRGRGAAGPLPVAPTGPVGYIAYALP
jgi:outer membrane protein assembly factor BamB